MLPVVALVGRPNVGKSTLFNALTRTRDALVADAPGLTRDRNYGVCREGERPFIVVDTGGLTAGQEGIAELSARQARLAIGEAAVVVFVVDARAGFNGRDREILAELRKTGRTLLLGVNKVDGMDQSAALSEFAASGLATVLPLSATHRQGIDALVQRILRELPAPPEEGEREALSTGTRVAIVGRPNVGKSTLLNRLLGEERMVASETPGTTRDAIHVPLERDGKRYMLIDTAGLRRRGKVEDAVEKFSAIKTLGALEQSDVAIVLLDASEGVTEQDSTVLGHAINAGRAMVIAVNKWDGLDSYKRDRCKVELDRRLDYAPYAVRVFISAKHGSGMGELMKAVDQAARSATREFTANELTEALAAAVEAHQPPLVNGRASKMRYAHQGGRNPPSVVIHGNRIANLVDSYKRYLENFFRKRFRLVGTPVRLEFREGSNPFAGRRNPLNDRQKKKRQRMIRHAKRRK